MDLSQDVSYREFSLNGDATLEGGVLSGVTIDEADLSAVTAVGYTEKRALADGNDASDVFLGPRRIFLTGSVYGATRAEAFDILQNLRSVFTATAAFADDERNFGYLPLYFRQTTDDPAFGASPGNPGNKSLYINCRPLANVQFKINRDASGGYASGSGSGDRPIAFRWSVVLEAKDPRIYVVDGTTVPIDGSLAAGLSGTVTNKGDYPAPVGLILFVDAHESGDFVLRMNGAVTKITVEDSADAQVYYYSGVNKVLEVETPATRVLRMDLLDVLNADFVHPVAQPGDNTYTVDAETMTLGVNSLLYFSDAFA